MRIPAPRNPVLALELRQRLRSRRATVVVTGYLGVLAAVLYVLYRATAASGSFGGGPSATQAAGLGRSAFETLVFVMLLLVCFIVPGLTADAVAGERERQTLVPLQVTLLAARSILFGKLAASVAFAALLVLATLPLLSVSFLLGGVRLRDVAVGVAGVLGVAVAVASTGLACSVLARRTQTAVVLANVVALFLVLGTFVLYAGQAALAPPGDGVPPPLVVLTPNPLMGVADAVGRKEADASGSVGSPLEALRLLIRSREGGDEAFVAGPRGAVLGVEGPARRRSAFERVPFWARTATALGALGAAAFWLANRRLRVPSPNGGA